MKDKMHFNSKTIHGGQEPDKAYGAVMPPIYQTSTYAQTTPGGHKGFEYSRTHNPTRQALERSLASIEAGEFAFAFGSGLAAMDAVLKLLKPGDEVITADFTFAATVEVISLLGLTPVLVDVDPQTFNISIESIQKVIGPKTKAIIPVHLFGQAADMEEILALADENNLFVVEDNAQSIGADYTFSNGSKMKTGTLGHVGTTSFFPSKNLGAYGDGGAIFTNDDETAHTIRGMVNHGMYIRYHHDVVGVNSRLDSVQAAILDIKLKYLDFYHASLFLNPKP